MNEGYEDLIAMFPPKKSPKRDTMLLKFHARSREVLRPKVSDTFSRGLGNAVAAAKCWAPVTPSSARG